MAVESEASRIIREATELFNSHRQELLDAGLQGQYFLARDGEFSTFMDMEEGLAEGYRRFGRPAFLFKEIQPTDRVGYITDLSRVEG